MMNSTDSSGISMWRTLSQALTLLCITSMLVGCPEAVLEEEEEVDKPTLLLSSFPVCTELILPEIDPRDPDAEPVYLPLEVRINGVSGSEASALNTQVSFDPPRNAACLQSSVVSESGEIENLRCMSNLGAKQDFTGSRRVSDAFYCTGTGRFQVKAKTKLNDADGTVIESNTLEITCLPTDVFENNCERPDEDQMDLGVVDMDLTDMDLTDMSVVPPPPEAWAVVLDTEQEVVTNLSVQGSASPYPKRATYVFSVIDEVGSPISMVPVKFYLDWSNGGADNYAECLSLCEEVDSAEACNEHPGCDWDEIERDEGDMGATDESDLGVDSGPPAGVCVPKENTGNDERCTGENDRCESNLCLPPNISGLPVAIEPLEAVTNGLGQVTVSVVTSQDPGIYSLRAVANFNGSRQEARTPNFTIWHQIPSQENISFRCKSPVVAGFFRRYEPNVDGGTDPLGYINYQRPASECDFQSVDRFTGRVAGVPVFFMSESGNIAQSVMSDDDGLATAMWHVGGRSPVNVNTIEHEYQSPTYGIDGHNARDGLVKLIAFTQGEARFIDKSADGTTLSGDRVYSKTTDIVPPHPEPYVDTNDNGQRDVGEPYHDANRNQTWDQDVFGRSQAVIDELRCYEQWVNRQLAAPQEDSDYDAFRDGCDGVDSGINTDLTEDNPSSLQTTIWTSTNVLSVGFPQAQENELRSACRGATCSATPICDAAVGGLDAYLAPGGVIEVEFFPRDDNNNCVGVEEVELLAEIKGEGSAQLSPIAPSPSFDGNMNILTPGIAHNILPHHCYHEGFPTVPYAHSFKFAVVYTPSPDSPPFSTATLDVSLKVPSYQVGEGTSISRTKIVRVGLCSQ